MNLINTTLAVLLATMISTAASADGNHLRRQLNSLPTCKSLDLGLATCQKCLDHCVETYPAPMQARCNGNGKGGVGRCWCDSKGKRVFDCKNQKKTKA